jgi:hypothetical protein
MRRFVGSATLLLVLTTTAAQAQDGSAVDLGGMTSKPPAEWKETRPMTQTQVKVFTLPKVEGDDRDAQLLVYFFGAGGAGGVQANVSRWKGMIQPPAGKNIDDIAKVNEFTVGQAKVTYLDASGTYLHRAQPNNPNSPTEQRPNHRLIAVAFESPKGPYYIRFVGPEKTVTHYKQGFDAWLKNFK